MSIEELKQLQKEIKSMNQHFEAFGKLILGKPGAVDEADSILKKIMPGEVFGRALDEWKTKAQSSIRQVRQGRKDSFGILMADFIRTEQAQNSSTREFDNAWRVGSLEVQIRRDSSQIQIAYNQQVVTKWTAVASFEDIKKHYDAAKQKLDKAALPVNVLIEVFWDAYDYLRHKQVKASNPQPSMVPLRDFYHECTLSLIRNSKREKKAQPQEFPVWAFLYNLDIYRREITNIPVERRLGLQTGTQSESSSKGVVTNGLDANHDYRTFCYIYAVEEQR